jgi:Leucine-rich repeat (LRR) protein
MELVWYRQNKTKIENLPNNNLQYFDCNNNQISVIENLPNGLQTFNCNNNQINKIENLPNSLQEFWCESNQISKIENLLNSLQKFWFGNNQIKYVDKLPIEWFNVRDGFNLRFYNIIKRLQRHHRRRYNIKTKMARIIEHGLSQLALLAQMQG